MSREESLGKRFLNYLGLEYELQEDFDSSGPIRVIKVFPPRMKADTWWCIPHNSWHNMLFGCHGRYGLCNLCKWLGDSSSPWYEYKLKAFQFENLDELEMQLSIRGF